MLDLVVQVAPGLPVELTQALDSAADYARSSKAQLTPADHAAFMRTLAGTEPTPELVALMRLPADVVAER